MKRILFVAATLALLLSACGPQATPTIDPVQVQASAIAAANTMVAMTMAAIPTATPIPPTPVPSPTLESPPTPISLPTLAVQPSPTVAPTSGGADTCNHLLDVKSSGPSTTLNLRNKTNGPVTISIGLSTKNVFGQCGYLSWQVGIRDSISVTVPQTGPGPCYWAYAWINDPKKPSNASGGGYCMNTAATWQLDINYDTFVLTPP